MLNEMSLTQHWNGVVIRCYCWLTGCQAKKFLKI